MSEATKAQALDKLKTIVNKIGYPENGKAMTVCRSTEVRYVLNVIRANEFNFNFDIKK